MIASVRGEVIDIALGHVVVEAGGVGYTVMATPSTLATLRRGTEARLVTAMIVREDLSALEVVPVIGGYALVLLSVSGAGAATGKASKRGAFHTSRVATGLGLTAIAVAVSIAVAPLIPLGQNAGQFVLSSVRGDIVAAVARVRTLTPLDFGATGPGLEIAQMRHERLRARMYMS